MSVNSVGTSNLIAGVVRSPSFGAASLVRGIYEKQLRVKTPSL